MNVIDRSLGNSFIIDAWNGRVYPFDLDLPAK